MIREEDLEILREDQYHYVAPPPTNILIDEDATCASSVTDAFRGGAELYVRSMYPSMDRLGDIGTIGPTMEDPHPNATVTTIRGQGLTPLEEEASKGSGNDHGDDKKKEKNGTAWSDTDAHSNQNSNEDSKGNEEDLAKIVALEEPQQDDHVALDIIPEQGLPGAYRGGPEGNEGRIQKAPLPQHPTSFPTPLPQHLRGDATPKEEAFFPTLDLEDADKFMEKSEKSQYRKVGLVTIGILLLLLAAIIPCVLLLGGDQGSEEPPQETQLSPEIRLVPNLTQYTIQALEDDGSYQSWAYHWVEKDPYWDTYEPWRQQQLFAMACVYYAFQGHSWKTKIQDMLKATWLIHGQDECAWQRPRSTCFDNGRLKALYLTNLLRLKGTLPREVAFLTQLETLDFSDSDIKGDLDTLLPLPAINALPALKDLNVSNCVISGTIPSTLGHLTTLTKLDLSMNLLSSTIPSELGLLSELNTLVLSKNDLNGTTPEEIRKIPSLMDFRVDNNSNLTLASGV